MCTFVVSVPAEVTEVAMPGDNATMLSEIEYACLSSFLASQMRNRFRRSPSDMGTVGQASRTSKTTGTRRRKWATDAGIATVNGVLVAKTT